MLESLGGDMWEALMNTSLQSAAQRLLIGLAGLLLLVGLTGCELNSTDEDASAAEEYFDNNPYSATERSDVARELSITPANFAISYINQRVVFSATGGEGAYRWSLASNIDGEISTRGANQAVYLVKQLLDNTITVQDAGGHYAAAYITLESNLVAMAISPTEITLAEGQLQASFTVSGGRSPYTWTTANAKLGAVSYKASSSYVASYTAASGVYGQNLILVQDADGSRVSAKITQKQ